MAETTPVEMNADERDAFLGVGGTGVLAFGESGDGYRSVVASGRLEPVRIEDIVDRSLAGLENVDIPSVDIFDRPVEEVSFELRRLAPKTLTTRRSRE